MIDRDANVYIYSRSESKKTTVNCNKTIFNYYCQIKNELSILSVSSSAVNLVSIVNNDYVKNIQPSFDYLN